MDMIIRIDLKDSGGKHAYAEYQFFYMGDENDAYRLHVDQYSGNAGDSLLYHDGMKFSTKDNTFAIFGTSCAERFRSAWWFRACHRSNLNGEYVIGSTASNAEGVKWMTLNPNRGSLAKTEMKIRPF